MHTQYKIPGGKKLLSELGNLTGGIFLSLGGMSTVKIRAGSLFHNTLSRIGAEGAGFELKSGWLEVAIKQSIQSSASSTQFCLCNSGSPGSLSKLRRYHQTTGTQQII
jgi:hypothetical protein